MGRILTGENGKSILESNSRGKRGGAGKGRVFQSFPMVQTFTEKR